MHVSFHLDKCTANSDCTASDANKVCTTGSCVCKAGFYAGRGGICVPSKKIHFMCSFGCCLSEIGLEDIIEINGFYLSPFHGLFGISLGIHDPDSQIINFPQNCKLSILMKWKQLVVQFLILPVDSEVFF